MFGSAITAQDGDGLAVASAGRQLSRPPIGRLQTVRGVVTIARADSVIVHPAIGDPVYQGDEIEAGVASLVAIAFVDGTIFHLYPGTRIALDQFPCGGDKFSNAAAILRVVKGMFRVVAGRLAATGRLAIDTPLAQIRSTAPAVGIGSFAFGILTFGLIEQLKAASANIALRDDEPINPNDLPHGVFVITTKDIPPRVIVVEDVTKTYWVRHGSSQVITNTASQMAQLHEDYLGTQGIYSQGQQDSFILQWQHAYAQPQSTQGGTGSSTAPNMLAFNPGTQGSSGGNGPSIQVSPNNNNQGGPTTTSQTLDIVTVVPPTAPDIVYWGVAQSGDWFAGEALGCYWAVPAGIVGGWEPEPSETFVINPYLNDAPTPVVVTLDETIIGGPYLDQGGFISSLLIGPGNVLDISNNESLTSSASLLNSGLLTVSNILDIFGTLELTGDPPALLLTGTVTVEAPAGEIEASAGTVTFLGADVYNGGTIQADSGGEIVLENGAIVGGTITIGVSGIFDVTGTSSIPGVPSVPGSSSIADAVIAIDASGRLLVDETLMLGSDVVQGGGTIAITPNGQIDISGPTVFGDNIVIDGGAVPGGGPITVERGQTLAFGDATLNDDAVTLVSGSGFFELGSSEFTSFPPQVSAGPLINNLGEVLGNSVVGSNIDTVAYDPSTNSYTTIEASLGSNVFSADTDGVSLNDAGQLVGTYTDSVGTLNGFIYSVGAYTYNTSTESYVYSSGSLTQLDDPQAGSGAGQGTNPLAINNAGQVIGTYTNSGGTYGFLYDPSDLPFDAFTTLQDSNGTDTSPTAINNSNQIVGTYEVDGTVHGFIYTISGPSYDVVTGTFASSGTFATLDDPSAGSSPGQGTTPLAINDFGEVVGTFINSAGEQEAFLYNPIGASWLTLTPAAGATNVTATSINDASEVVGTYTASNGVLYGYLYDPGIGYITITEPDAGTSSGQGTEALSINNAGQIVGVYFDSSGDEHVFVDYPFAATLLVNAGSTLTLNSTNINQGSGSTIPGGIVTIDGTLDAASGSNTIANTTSVTVGSGGAITVDAGASLTLSDEAFTNDGTVNADGANALLALQTGNPIDNAGLLEASAGGEIDVHDSAIDWQGASAGGAGTDGILLTGRGSTLLVDSASGTLALGGSTPDSAVFLGAGSQIVATTSGETLDNVNNVISGDGAIGNDNGDLTFNNEGAGAVDADVPLQTLTIFTGNPVGNAGLLEATGAGILDIQDPVNNSGLLEASGGSELDISGDSVSWVGAAAGIAGTNGILLSGSGDTLLVASADGTLTLNGSTNGGAVSLGVGSQIIAISTETLDNVNNVISGDGNIGSTATLGNLTLNNESGGTIDADVSGQTLTIHTGVTANSNAGLMEATSGGILQIEDYFDNTGQITVGASSSLRLNGGTISGGNVSIAGSLEVDSGTSLIQGVTATDDPGNTAELIVENGATLTLDHDNFSGGLITIIVESGGTLNVTNHSFIADAEVETAPGGTLDISDSTVETIKSVLSGTNTVEPSKTLTLIDETVFGTITNQGTIDVETAGVSPNGAAFDGAVVTTITPGVGIKVGATTDATLLLDDGAIISGSSLTLGGTSTIGTVDVEKGDDASPPWGGTLDAVVVSAFAPDDLIEIGTSSRATLTILDVTSISGGTLSNALGGTIDVGTASAKAEVTIESEDSGVATGSFSNSGQLTVASGSTLTLTDDYIFNAGGTITVASGGTLTFTDTGSNTDTVLGGTLNIYGALNADDTDTISGANITIDSGATLSTDGTDTLTADTITNDGVGGAIVVSGGSLTLNSGTSISNTTTSDTITVDSGATLRLDDTSSISGGGITIDGGGTLTMAGSGAGDSISGSTVTVDSAGQLKLTGIDTISGANITIDSGATLSTDGTDTISSATVTIESGGTLAATGGTLTIDPGSLTNSGTLSAAAGTLIVDNSVSGPGSAEISDGGTLELGAADAESLTFDGVGTLKLDSPSNLTGTVFGLVTGDTIDLAHTIVATAVWNGSTLTVNGAPTAFPISSLPVGDTFAFKSDGAGGTDLKVLPQVLNISSSAVAGVEGTAIALTFSIALSGATLTSFVISGIPDGATLSDGTNGYTSDTADGSVDVHSWDLAKLTITPANDTNFTLSAMVTAVDGNGYSYTVPTTESVTVDPQPPAVSPVATTGVEGTAIALNLGIKVNGLPSDNNTLESLMVSAIPIGATLNDGHGNSFTASTGDTSVNIASWDISALTITPANDTNFVLNVAATVQDAEANLSTTTKATASVTVDPEAPTLEPVAVSGTEGQAIALNLGLNIKGLPGDTNSLASLVVSAIPIGDTLSDGHGNSFTASSGDTAVNIAAWNLSGLTITPASDTDFTLTVAATEKDADGNLSATTTATEGVTVNALGWSGNTLVENYYYPTSTAVYYTSPNFSVPASHIEGNPDNGGAFYLSVTANTITASGFTFSGFWNSAPFNGFEVVDLSGNPDISGVTIAASTNMTGLTSSDISFDSNAVWVNWEGLSFNKNTIVTLDVTFDPTLDPSQVTPVQMLDGTTSPVDNIGPLTVADGTELALAGTIDNAGLIAVDGVTAATAIGIDGTVTLQGGGQIALSESDLNYIFGSGTLINVDNTIVGGGDIGNGSIIFDNAGTIEAQGPYALIIDTGTNPFVDTGTLETDGGTMIVDSPVVGAGMAIIVGGTLEFTGLSDSNVDFSAGAAGVLALDQSQNFTGHISGFGVRDQIDLGDVGYSASTSLQYVANSSDTGGTLTVTDGSHTANLALIGEYASSMFVLSSDGSGGTLITDVTGTTASATVSGGSSGAALVSSPDTPEDVGAGQSLTIDTAYNQIVTFTGGTGSLVLNDPEAFSGQIVGFTGTAADAAHSDTIDLVGINYNSSGFSESYNSTTGLLTVTDGTNTATITFDDFNATLDFASDGDGGTLITDPPTSSLSSAAADPTLFDWVMKFTDDKIDLDANAPSNQSDGAADPNDAQGGLVTTHNGSDHFIFHQDLGTQTTGNSNPNQIAEELENHHDAEHMQQLTASITPESHHEAFIDLVHIDNLALSQNASHAQWHQAIADGFHLH